MNTLRLAVLGDSLSEGVGDPAPGSWGRRLHGWVHHLVVMSAERGVQVEPLLLARRGAHIGQVVALQLPQVPADGVDVAVLLIGFNDVVHRRLDTDRFARLYAHAAAQLAGRTPLLVLGTLHDLTRTLPLPPAMTRVVRAHIAVVNESVRAAAVRHDAVVLDLASLQHSIGRSTISIDLLHPTRAGHQQLASQIADLLVDRRRLPEPDRPTVPAVPVVPPSRTLPARPVPAWPGLSARVAAESRHLLWLCRDGGPWLVRDLWARRPSRHRPTG